MTDHLVCRDVYFRIDKGPVQHTRVWDMENWVDQQLNNNIDADTKKPRLFQLSTENDYRFERGWK